MGGPEVAGRVMGAACASVRGPAQGQRTAPHRGRGGDGRGAARRRRSRHAAHAAHPAPARTVPPHLLLRRGRRRLGDRGAVLGVGGFFGIRALQGPPSSGEEEVATEQTVPEGGEVIAEAPVGPDEAVAHDAVVPFEPTEDSGRVDVRITAVDRDATEEIRETNSLNDEPPRG